MSKKYDAIVVGAGLGGLSVATLLARRGFETLLLERHNVPGGFATSFVRGRYEFEVALHELSDMGTEERPGVLRKYLDYLGVTDKVEFVLIPELYRSVFPDLDISLPMGREAYTDTVCRAFPHEAGGIRRFMKRVFKLSGEVDELAKLQTASFPRALSRAAALPFKLRAVPRYLFTTWGEVLKRDVKDERARAVLSQYWGYFGLPPSKVSFFYFALGLASYVRFGASHVRGRSQALSTAFVERFSELGGEVRMNCGVKKINTSDGGVTGVITEHGDEILSDIVVCNSDQISTYNDLLGRENVPPRAFKKLKSGEIAPSSFNVYMGVAKPLEHFGVSDHEIFINDGYDLESQYEKFSLLSPPGVTVAACYNSILPDISPPGTSVITMTGLMYGKPWCSLPPEEYFERKTQIADVIIDKAEQVLPGLRNVIEVVEVSTPITNMRYAGTLGGSIYGFNNTPWNHTVLRPSARTSIGGLYFVGAWVQPGGGFSPAMISCQFAGEFITMKLKRKIRRR